MRQLARINRFGVQARCLTVRPRHDVCLILFLGSTLAIDATGNLGYILAHVLALAAFVLLRRDRPGWSRPIRVPDWYVPVAAVLAVTLLGVLVIGATSFDLTGHGGWRELAVAAGVLGLSVALYLYRTLGQDRRPLRLRDRGAAPVTDEP